MLEKEFVDFGYTKEEYMLIRNSYAISKYNDETLLKKFKEIIQFFFNLGYSREEVIKITKRLPTIYGLSVESMKQKIEDIVSLGYSREEVIKMTKRLPTIYGLSIENMKQKIEDIVSLGYSREEVIKMTESHPAIYSYNIESMKQKIEDIVSLGYSREEVIMMTKGLPTIYGLSIENIKQKIDFYDSIDMHELATINPKYLMQSVSLSYARYQYFLANGIKLDMSNYKKLFINNKQFEKLYGIGKTELLKLYDYEKCMEAKNDRTI